MNATLKAKSESLLLGVARFYNARLWRSPRLAPTILWALLAAEFVSLCVEAYKKPFWYDELFTVHGSGMSSFALLGRALMAGIDSMPPYYYELIRLVGRLPGDPQVVLRLPSIIGYLLALLGVYWFASRKMPAFAGLAAALLISLSLFRPYAIELRPYSLLVGFLAVAAAAWQRIGEKRFMTPILAMLLAMTATVHYSGIMAVSVFIAAELAFEAAWRRVRWGVWAAFLPAVGVSLLAFPFFSRFEALYFNPADTPGWGTVISTYGAYMGVETKLVLVVIALFVLHVALPAALRPISPDRAQLVRNFSLPEFVVVGGFLFYAGAFVVVSRIRHAGYHFRYGWPSILGLALAIVCLFAMMTIPWGRLVLALLIAFAAQCCFNLTAPPKWVFSRDGARWEKLAQAARVEPGAPIVVASGISYVEMAYYAPPDLRQRLEAVADTQSALRYIGSDRVDKVLRASVPFTDLRVEDLKQFQAVHQRFLLYSGGPFEWFTPYLVERGYSLKLLLVDGPGYSLYLAAR
jgi:hypothetical protein